MAMTFLINLTERLNIKDLSYVFGQADTNAPIKSMTTLFGTIGIRYTEDEKSDVGGKNWSCSVWNSCFPSTEIWGNRFSFLPNLNALAPNFHIAGGQYAGVNCEAGGGPYGGGPYFGGTGCMVQSLPQTSNDVAAELR